MKTLIQNGNVMLRQENGLVFEKRHLLIEDGFITQVISRDSPNVAAPDAEHIVDAGGGLILPGLVNAHYHSYDNLVRGAGWEQPLEIWTLRPAAWRQNYTPREAYISTQLGCLELIESGCTGVIDQVKFSSSDESDCYLAVVEAYRQSGLRAIVLPVLADLPLEATLPLTLVERDGIRTRNRARIMPAGEQIERLRRLVEVVKFQGEGRVRVGVGPSGPQRCSDTLMAAAGDLARSYGAILHTHALESVLQREVSRGYPEGSLISHLGTLELLTPNLQLVHMVWATAPDLERIAEAGSQVIYNPVSNVFLGSGLAPVAEMQAIGIPLALGTDSVCCNGSNNLFESMKWAALSNHIATPDPVRWFDAGTALEMATRGGYRALQMEGVGGDLAPGKVADFVLLGRESVSLFLSNDPVRQVVYSAGPSDVNQVWIAGNCVYADGTVQTMDKAAILAEARELMEKRKREIPKNRSLPEVEKWIWQAYRRAIAT